MTPEALTEERARLAEAQAELVRALVAGGPAPAGFDAARLALAARSLANKRRQETAHAWPALARCLGDDFAERFSAFAREPLPARGGPLADGRAFAATLPARLLDDDARLEVLAVDLRQRRARDGLVARRGPALRWAWLPRARRLVLGVRLPGLGVRLLAVPVGLRRG
jgi:hypothetical protein